MIKKTEKSSDKVRDDKGRFAPGNQEGWRGGRNKKEFSIPQILRTIGDETVTDPRTGKEMSSLEYVLRQVYARAAKGNMDAVNFIADRAEGRVSDRLILHDERNIDLQEKLKELSSMTTEEIIEEINQEIRRTKY
jgi:hypothetical protein